MSAACDLTVLTPTGDRPEALALCACWMARQTYEGRVLWLVVDDGREDQGSLWLSGLARSNDRLPSNWDIHYVHRPTVQGRVLSSLPPRPTLPEQLLFALQGDAIQSDVLAIVEDDDHYKPRYLEQAARALEYADVWGSSLTRYYQVTTGLYREMAHPGRSSLFHTAMRRSAYGVLDWAAREASAKKASFVDMEFWRFAQRKVADLRGNFRSVLQPIPLACGMKCLPGRPGIGAGHGDRIYGDRDDLQGTVLRSWVGDEAAETYLGYRSVTCPDV